jgi:hypothetical protein
MSALTTSMAVAAFVFAGGMIGLHLHRLLSERQLSKETQDVIRLGTGMLSVLASLVLGLMIATANTSCTSTSTAVRAYAADLTALDQTLRDYGDEALAARREVRNYTTKLLNDVWTRQYYHPYMVEDREAGSILEHVQESIRGLNPANHDQQWLADEGLRLSTSLLRERWLLIERTGPSVQPVMVVILVSWVAAIFVSFGMNAPRHATMHTVFLVLSLAIGSAMFLILEMDSPFDGVMQISGQPVETALEHMVPAGQ